MMSDSETNHIMSEQERQDLLNDLIRERFGEWATRKTVIKDSEK
jgi:hypothetical protein